MSFVCSAKLTSVEVLD